MHEKKINKDIELRSEKVRNIVGKIPPILLRIGISIISIIILLALLLAYIIPYPEYYITDMTVTIKPHINNILSPISGVYYKNAEYPYQGIIVSDDSIVMMTFCDKYNITSDLDSTPVQRHDIIAIASSEKLSLWGKCRIPLQEINNISYGQEVDILTSSNESCIGTIKEIGKILQVDSISNESYYNIMVEFRSKIETEKLINLRFKTKILLSNRPILKRVLYKY